MNFHSTDIEEFQKYIAGCVIVAGDSHLDLEWEGPVHVAIIHDSSGFTPAAAIHIEDGSYTHPDDALEQAFDMLREHDLEHYPDHVKELQEEWGDNWCEILTEGYNGKVWTLPVFPTAWAICADKFAAQHVDIEQ